ncbi:MAG: FAD-binding protein, partial [Waddliaceae bacterium]
PPVVPELKSITIGGALSGCGIDSSSFRYGLVHETIKEMEVLLSDGRVVTCNPNNDHKDLFFAFPNTFGTLGYALKIKVQLIPVKKYVKLSHIHFSDPKKYFEELNRLCQENREGETIANIDGVIFNKDEMYITTGEYVDEAPCTSQYRYKNIYYQSIKNLRKDFLSSLDYIWRWDTDWFWRSKVFFLQNPFIRLLFGKCMLNSTVYTKIMHFVNRHSLLRSFLNSIGGKKESVIQDVVIPIQHAPYFLDFFTGEIGIKPIWICPIQPYSKNARFDFCPMDPDTLYIDFGFWDAVKTDKEEGYYNRKIEKMVTDLGGFKSLYSTSYYTEDEFWELYNRSQYLKLKKKYDPEGLFKGLYEKCSTK